MHHCWVMYIPYPGQLEVCQIMVTVITTEDAALHCMPHNSACTEGGNVFALHGGVPVNCYIQG